MPQFFCFCACLKKVKPSELQPDFHDRSLDISIRIHGQFAERRNCDVKSQTKVCAEKGSTLYDSYDLSHVSQDHIKETNFLECKYFIEHEPNPMGIVNGENNHRDNNTHDKDNSFISTKQTTEKTSFWHDKARNLKKLVLKDVFLSKVSSTKKINAVDNFLPDGQTCFDVKDEYLSDNSYDDDTNSMLEESFVSSSDKIFESTIQHSSLFSIDKCMYIERCSLSEDCQSIYHTEDDNFAGFLKLTFLEN